MISKCKTLVYGVISLVLISATQAMDTAIVSTAAASSFRSPLTLEDIAQTMTSAARQRFRNIFNPLSPDHITFMNTHAETLFPPALRQEGLLCCEVLELLTDRAVYPLRYISQPFKDIAGAIMARKTRLGFDQTSSSSMGYLAELPPSALVKVLSYIPPTKRTNTICSNKTLYYWSGKEQRIHGDSIAQQLENSIHSHPNAIFSDSIRQAGLALWRLVQVDDLAPLPQTQHVTQLLQLMRYSLQQNTIWPLTVCNQIFSDHGKPTERHYAIADNVLHLFHATMDRWGCAWIISDLLSGTPQLHATMDRWGCAWIISDLLRGTPQQIQIIADNAPRLFSDGMDGWGCAMVISALLRGTLQQIQAIVANAPRLFHATMDGVARAWIINAALQVPADQIGPRCPSHRR